MKNKDEILHICLLCAFAFQLIFMFMDIGDYGFLSSSIITFADLLILARLLIFVPLCIYEVFKFYNCVIEEKKNDKKRYHHRHHHRHSHSHHHSHSSSDGMSAEYRQKTYFMDTEKLLEKQREEKQEKYAQENKEN